ncbi:hypothetical protein GCM10029963_00800 [Micromonospora andamanensis]
MDGAGESLDVDDVLVVIEHPFGEVEASLAEWIATGPARVASFDRCARVLGRPGGVCRCR